MDLPPKKRSRRESDPGIFESCTVPHLPPTVRVVSAPASDDGSSGSDSMESGGDNVADNEMLIIRLTVSKLPDAAWELQSVAGGFSEWTAPGPRATTHEKTCAGDIVAVPGPSKRAPPLRGAMEQRTVVTSKAGAESQDVSNAYETVEIPVNLEPYGPNSAFDTAARSVTLSPTGDQDMQQPLLGVIDTPPIPSTSAQVTLAAPAPSAAPFGTMEIDDDDIACWQLPTSTPAHLEEQEQWEYVVVLYEDLYEEERMQNWEHNEGRGAGDEGGPPVPVEDNWDEGGSPLSVDDNSDSSGEQESHSSDEDIRQTVRNIGF